MASRVVRRERIFPLARITGLQNACARVALAVSDLHDLSELSWPPLPTGSVALQGREFGLAVRNAGTIGAPGRDILSGKRPGCDPGGFLSTLRLEGAALYRAARSPAR